MKPVELEVDRLVVAVDEGAARSPEVPERLREALRRLGERLQGTRPPGGAGLRTMALGRLVLDPGTTRDLLAPGGAERLAEELYGRIREAL